MVAQQEPLTAPISWERRAVKWWEDSAKNVFLLPTVLFILLLSVFPLVASLFVAFNRVQLVRGGFNFTFVGLDNFRKLLFGTEQRHFVAKFGTLDPVWGIVGIIFVGAMLYMLYTYARSKRRTIFGLIMRVVTIAIALPLFGVAALALSGEGLPGTIVVTLISRHPRTQRQTLFPCDFPAADDDYARRYRLLVSHDGRYGQRSAVAAVDWRGLGQHLMGGYAFWRACGGDDWGHLAMDAVHVHHSAGSARRNFARTG
jgi:hypothetical protein